MKLYLDEGSHVGLDGKPFWYGGLLNIFNTVEGQELRPNDKWDNVEQSKAKFREFYARMSSARQGGLIQTALMLRQRQKKPVLARFHEKNFSRCFRRSWKIVSN